MKFIALIFFLVFTSTYAQLKGCTDILSKNITNSATINDGSCVYKKIKIKSDYSIKIDNTIKETSGLVSFANLLWTHNDDHDKTIYGLDSLGKIQKKIILNTVTNHDWEEIAQDSSYLYIGDFGNNYSGNRTNLQILKIEKESFLEGNPKIENISFAYSDQTDFNLRKPNTTNFDCEAFIVSKDSIYLFTKQWQSSKTNIYALSKQSGNHVAKLKDSLDVKGLVTGAAYLEDKRLIALCGYSKIGKPFIYLLYDFNNHDFLSGNKRKIDLQLSFHQIEGIATKDGLHYYLTNESLVRKPLLNVPQQIHRFDLSSVLNSYLHK
ncbi:hypothetical protein AR687_12000 [Flavobacteriaceae bacterium CRH]|nr:hypothetical protein AR687_12000 [Flavobacteriaceae bacterium CRH]